MERPVGELLDDVDQLFALEGRQEAVIDPDRTAIDVARLLASPKVSPRITVAGYGYDLETGLVRPVVVPAQPSDRNRRPGPTA
jgi:hypothetical protein